MGIDQVIDNLVNRLGKPERRYLVDDYVDGKGARIVDMILVGNFDFILLNELTKKT